MRRQISPARKVGELRFAGDGRSRREDVVIRRIAQLITIGGSTLSSRISALLQPTHVDRLEQLGFVPVHVPNIK
ncbi:MAG TPA: hypothetical protein VGJ78_07540, partial [Vicinamibacterales bacterium]